MDVCTDDGVPVICSVSNAAPRVGDLVTLTGHHFHDQSTAGWNGFLTEDLNRFSFEGETGAPVASLGYTDIGAGGRITDETALLGAKSARYRSAANNPRCSNGRGGIAEAQSYLFNKDGNITEGYVGFYVKWDPYIGWPTDFQKILMFPNAGYFLQPANGMRTSKNWNPSKFILFEGGDVIATFSINPDGGQLESNKWYYFDFHAKVTSPTDFTLRVNGTKIVSLRPPVMSQRANELLMFGWPNGCGRQTWGVDAWFDAFVFSSEPAFPPSEVWLCPTSDETDMSRCVWQFQESISDSAESFTFRNKGGRNTIKPGTRYIKVRNQQRQLSAGFAVTVS